MKFRQPSPAMCICGLAGLMSTTTMYHVIRPIMESGSDDARLLTDGHVASGIAEVECDRFGRACCAMREQRVGKMRQEGWGEREGSMQASNARDVHVKGACPESLRPGS